MKGKKLWIFAVALIIAPLLGTMVWMLWPEPEPVYQGKPLSYWFARSDEVGLGVYVFQERNSTNIDAIRQIGTNALPTLLRLIRAQDSFLTPKLNWCLDRLPGLQFRFQDTSSKHWHAYLGFEVLPDVSSNAVPELIRIYERRPYPLYQRENLARIFASIGPVASPAVPYLALAIRSDPLVDQRLAAVEALRDIGERHEISIPALVLALRDSDSDVRFSAVLALRKFETWPDTIIPALIDACADPYNLVRSSAAESLGELKSLPQISIPALVALLDDPDEIARFDALKALAAFGPQARAALPTFQRWYSQGLHPTGLLGEDGLDSTKEALKSISPSNSELCDFPN